MKLITKRAISGLLCCLIIGVQLIVIGKISIGGPITGSGYHNVINTLGGTPDPELT